MFDQIKVTIKHTAVYGLGNIAIKFMGLILLPLYTSHISVSDYGVLGILEVSVMILVQTFILGQAQAYMRFFGIIDYKDQQKKILFTLTALLTVSCGILLLIGQLASRPLAALFFDNKHFAIYFKLIFYQVVFQILNTLFLSVLRAQEKSAFYSIAVGLKLFIVFSLNIILLTRCAMGIEGILIAGLAGEGILFIALLPYMMKNMQFSFLPDRLKEGLVFGLPLILTGLAHMLLNVGDRYLLKLFVDYDQIGLYNLGYKLGGTLNLLLIQSFQLGLLPIVYKMYGQPNDKRFYSKLFTYFLYVLIWAGLGLAAFSKEVLIMFARDSAYWPASSLVPLIVLGYIFIGGKTVLNIGLYLKSATKSIAINTAIAVIVNILLNLLCIPIWGIYGAAFATIAASVLLFGLTWLAGNKTYKIKWETKRVVILLILGMLLYSLTLLTKNFSLPLTIVFKAIIILSFPLILYFIKFYEFVELESIKKFIRQLIHK